MFFRCVFFRRFLLSGKLRFIKVFCDGFWVGFSEVYWLEGDEILGFFFLGIVVCRYDVE